MKRLFIFYLLYLLSCQISAQNSASGMKIGKTISQSVLLDIGTAYIPENTELLDPSVFNVRTGRPSTVNLYFYRPVEIVGKYFMFKPGIGLGLDNYFFENDLVFSPVGDTVFIDNDPDRHYEKSKLSANYVDIPLEFRFATSPNSAKGFKLEFGGKVGVLFNGHSKIKYDFNDETVKVKFNDGSLSRFRYGLTGRIGYKRVMFFAYYSLSPLFDEDFGPEIKPLIFGLTLSSL